MDGTASTVALGLILFAAMAWITGGVVRVVLVFLGTAPGYAGNVGGLAALVTFVLLVAYGAYRLAFGG